MALAALLALASTGCGLKNSADEFPLSDGFQPLEPMTPTATFPPAAGNELYPQGLGPIVPIANFAHYTSHARGYLHAPLARVYQALQDPAASYLHNQNGATLLAGPTDFKVEPFPVSFLVHYRNDTKVGPKTITTYFDVTYRAGPLEGTDAAPIVIGERYQKTWGIENISVMKGSLVATAVPGAPDVTQVEMIAWLQATTQGQSDCDGTLVDLFGDLATTVANLP
jgi:hypothetical protein